VTFLRPRVELPDKEALNKFSRARYIYEQYGSVGLRIQQILLRRWLDNEAYPTTPILEKLLSRNTHRKGKQAVQRRLREYEKKGFVRIGPDGTVRLTAEMANVFFERVQKSDAGWYRIQLLRDVTSSMRKFLVGRGYLSAGEKLTIEGDNFVIKGPGKSRSVVALTALKTSFSHLLESEPERFEKWELLLPEMKPLLVH